MTIKILRSKIRNFKVFADFEADFEQADLILFDGPNGFGKTSFYDAIELLITGTIKRFDRLSRLVDRRVAYNENPYLNYQHTDGDIEIRIAVQIDGAVYFLCRKALNADLGKTADFGSFKLYQLSNFDDSIGQLIPDENAFLQEIFGKNYRENFPFLNYVEQEDHTHLLKNTESEKKQHISHLFNVQQFELAISQYELIKRQVGDLCKPDVERTLKEQAKRIEELKTSLKSSDEIEFEQLLSNQSEPWDQAQINFSESLYSKWLGENGELTLLKAIVANRENFISYLADERLDKIIASPEILPFLRYYYFITQLDTFKSKQLLYEQLTDLIDTFEELTTDSIEDEELELPPEAAIVLRAINETVVDFYEDRLANLRKQRKLASDFEKSLTDLQSSRNRLFEKFNQHEAHLDEKDTNCPLCGENWSDHSELLAAIARQTSVLDDLVNNSNSSLITAFEDFKDNAINAVIELIEIYINDNPVDPEFIKSLLEQNVDDFARKSAIFEQIGIDVSAYLNTEPVNDAALLTVELISALKEFRNGYDPEIEYEPLVEIYQKYFRANREQFTELTLEQIESKIKYVEWSYSVFQNELISNEERAYVKAKNIFDDANALSTKLKDVIDTYKKSLKEYNQALIRDIEILFHIYSGRIVQDFQGGLGLFIKEDRGIKFVTDPDKTYDAVFSMSAGQLAALIISFTLALNKKYSTNKILFIDDPVQTMDELNIASFIEVLRRDFGDRQIFISTHEDSMSTFIRYKFKKQGLAVKRVNMKNLLN